MADLKNIKNKTYHNFMRVYNAMINEKHYSPEDAEKLTRQVFDNWEDDKTRGARSIQYWYDVKLSREEYERRENKTLQAAAPESIHAREDFIK